MPSLVSFGRTECIVCRQKGGAELFETELQLFQKKLLLLEPVQYFNFGLGIQTTELVSFKAKQSSLFGTSDAMKIESNSYVFYYCGWFDF